MLSNIADIVDCDIVGRIAFLSTCYNTMPLIITIERCISNLEVNSMHLCPVWHWVVEYRYRYFLQLGVQFCNNGLQVVFDVQIHDKWLITKLYIYGLLFYCEYFIIRIYKTNYIRSSRATANFKNTTSEESIY